MKAAIGIMIEGQEGLSWERWRRLCREVEELGFDSLWRSDHFNSVMDVPGRECIETWVSLAAAAEWTRRVEFGPLVCSMTFRHPALLARLAASVDQLSGGRLVLGVGAGWKQSEHEMYEIPFPSLKERMDNLEDGIRLVRKTLEIALPKPARRPLPLLIGGSGERRTLRLVAQHADEWNSHGQDPDAYRAKTAVLARHCREVDRDPESIRRSVMMGYLVGRNPAELRERAAAVREVIPRLQGMEPDQVIDSLRAGWAVGTPAEVAERLQAFARLGASRFMLQHFLMDDSAALRLLAEEVLPQLSA
ncbi:MAG TPA: LLM class flavin-dependent oxidoreductase [Candidatus Acidoferrales bacterium]|nr:LLM class flavin-dependent oxidoreductase [Candidatus Acidoferrales bacterium]